jgi:TonB family protein
VVRFVFLTLAVYLLCSPSSFAQQENSIARAQSAPAYPDSANGLKKLFRDVLDARRAADSDKLDRLMQSLALPEYRQWFQSTFGQERGSRIAESYSKMSVNMDSMLRDSISRILDEKLDHVEVLRFEESCSLEVSADQYPILEARLQPIPFYAVDFSDGKRGRTLWFFARAGDAFRYLGIIRFEPPPGLLGPGRLEVPLEAQQAKLLHMERPIYPERARRNYLSGNVRMWAVIGEDGSVRDLNLQFGHCWLVPSAMEAVRKWRYEPTLVNGKAVSVSTIIEVHYILGNPKQ